MTEYTKRYVNLWIKEDKNGNPMLSGKDKQTGSWFYVFTDKDDETVKRLAMSPPDGEMLTVGDLEKGVSDYGEYLKFKNYFIAENRFYDEADPFIRNKKKEYVLNKDGEKIPMPEYTLIISSAKEE